MPVLCVRNDAGDNPLAANVVAIIARTLMERCGIGLERGADEAAVTLALRPGIGAEGYVIEDAPGGVLVAGNDLTGLRAGVGRLLHDARYAPGEFTPGRWRGVSVPQCAVRGIYCAFNFNNWYAACPRDELRRYLEELSLWGFNAIFFSVHFPDPDDAAALRRHIAATREVIALTHEAGLGVGFLNSPNIGMSGIPEAWRAVDVPDTVPARRGNIGTRICPSQPGAMAWLEERFETYFTGYDDLGLEYVATFPYDAGGCGCPDCWPWGVKGFVELSKLFFAVARRHYPACTRVLATWCYDVREESDGEFAGLDRLLRDDASWVDYLMIDAHEDFPRWPLEHGTPGGLPAVNFAEITMWGRYPWGGFGANPLPARFERLWRGAKGMLDGGFPYSEGIFEDINKVVVSHFYRDTEANAEDAVRAYVAYEFSPEVADAVTEAIYLLEETYPREGRDPEKVRRAWALLAAADAKLPDYARTGWR
ncbi:MAG TPA: hypothetical protein PLZ36_10615, partial [Armatimonadota bacterium]|nr:hypothetical protein [Armatimonadota bacterium]